MTETSEAMVFIAAGLKNTAAPVKPHLTPTRRADGGNRVGDDHAAPKHRGASRISPDAGGIRRSSSQNLEAERTTVAEKNDAKKSRLVPAEGVEPVLKLRVIS